MLRQSALLNELKCSPVFPLSLDFVLGGFRSVQGFESTRTFRINIRCVKHSLSLLPRNTLKGLQ